MADVNITQADADFLISMEKHRLDDQVWLFPGPGGRVSISLISLDKRETFMLDVTRSQIKLTKATYQNRVRQAIILMRLDIDGAPHRNPDESGIPCPHLHVYREGYGDKWAIAAPSGIYGTSMNLSSLFRAFMRHCNITSPPEFQMGLFS